MLKKDKGNYRFSFSFEYGQLDDGTIWIIPPSSHLFHIDPLTLRIILELNSGSLVYVVGKKYDIPEDEIFSALAKFEKEKAIVEPKSGRIKNSEKSTEDIDLLFISLVLIFLGIMQADYFRNIAKTYLLNNWHDGIIVGIIAVGAVFFHELGHYATFKKYLGFKPKCGFTFLFIFPAIYVDTQL